METLRKNMILKRFNKSFVFVLVGVFLFLVFAVPNQAIADTLIGDLIDGSYDAYGTVLNHNLFNPVDSWAMVPNSDWSTKILRDHYTEQPYDVLVTDPGEEFAAMVTSYPISPPGGGWAIGAERYLIVEFTADEVIVEEWYEFKDDMGNEVSATWFEQSYAFAGDRLRFLDLDYKDDSGSTMPIIGLELIESTYDNAPIASVIDNHSISIIPQDGGTFNSTNDWNFMARYKILTGSGAEDTTLPTAICGEPTPPGNLEISFQDLESGMDSIFLIGNPPINQNANISIPSFDVGTTEEVIITVERIDHALEALVALRGVDVAGNPRNIGCSIPAGVITPPAGNTSAGSDVEVTDDGVTITFETVTVSGDTTVTESDFGPPLSANFQTCDPPVYYDISTTATYSGTIEICLTYDDSMCDETDLHLFHYEGDTWVDVTTSVNTTSNMICGEVTSLSVFLIAYPELLSTDIGLRLYDGIEVISIACEPEGTVTSPLRIAKNGIVYGVILVDPEDPMASAMVIQTADGPKAIAKITN